MEDNSLTTEPIPSTTNPVTPVALTAPSPQKPLPRFDSVSPREWFAVATSKRSRGSNRKDFYVARTQVHEHPPAGILDASVFVSCYQCGRMLFFRHASLEFAANMLMEMEWAVSYPPKTTSEARTQGAGLWLCPECMQALHAAERELKSSAPKVG